MRTRSLNIVVCALVGSFLATALIGHLDASGRIGAAAPPSTAPAEDGAVGGNQGIVLVDGLGSGGQPDDIPREIVIADARFLFDRIVPLSRQELVRIAQEQETIAYARSEEGPFAAVYLSAPNRSEDELARYLPEAVGSSDVTCPAEAVAFERVDAGGSLYAFAGNETDLTADLLQAVGDSDGEPIYSDLNTAQPFPELFFGSGEGLRRFVLTGEDGRPASIAGSLAFNGAEFAFDSDATDAVDPATLTKVGCSTAFPVYAPPATTDGTFTQLYVLAGTRFFLFTGEGAAEATEPPTTTTVPETTTTVPETTTSTTTTVPETTTTVPETTTATTTTVPETTTSTSTTSSTPPTSPTTADIEPPAVVPTLPPDAPPPAIVNATPQTTCIGDPGELNTQGIPAHLPTRIQLGGVAYLFVGAEAPDAVGTLTRIDCIGPFESASTDQADQAQVIYLRATGSGTASQQVYRFEVALTYQIQLEVTEQPQVISAADQSYRLGQVWQPSLYSSTSVILFVQDSANPAPEVIYGLNVSQTVVGDFIGEYRLPGETAQPSEEMIAAAEQAGLNPDLTINGLDYILVDVYTPTGTTRNGFMTLFGTTTEGTPEMLLGRDKRELELFIFVVNAPAETGS